MECVLVFHSLLYSKYLVNTTPTGSKTALILMHTPFASTRQSGEDNASEEIRCDAYHTYSYVNFTWEFITFLVNLYSHWFAPGCWNPFSCTDWPQKLCWLHFQYFAAISNRGMRQLICCSCIMYFKNTQLWISSISDEELVSICIGLLVGISGRRSRKLLLEVFFPTSHPTLLRVNHCSAGFLKQFAYTRHQWNSISNQSVNVATISDSRIHFHFPTLS